MLQRNRQERIMELLRTHREITVKELCAVLYSSPATIRRDLSELEGKGLLRRSFGGAVLNETYPDQLPLMIRRAEHITEKKRIAAKAAALISPGDTVFIDASSTTYFLAKHLSQVEDLSVITNNPHLCTVLSAHRVRCLCTGGEMLFSSVALVGSEAERFVQTFYASALFFSARGYEDGEISDSSKGERDIKRAMIERSAKQYFLCDTSKYGRRFPYRIADGAEMDAIFDEKN